MPYLVDARTDLNKHVAEAAGAGRKVFLGGRRVEGTEGDERWFNSGVLLGDDGEIEASYDKHHLVPFGEYLPFPNFFDKFGLQALAQNAGRFSAGSGPLKISQEGLPAFQPLICYEAIFGHEILTGADRAEWLLHITNDAWFGESSGPFQHFAQARARAIEHGLPVARSANTGISAVIDPFGRIVEKIDLGKEGYIDVPLPQALPPTFFNRWGEMSWVLLAFLAIVGTVVYERRSTTN